jgi:hypothetical protein
MLLIFLGNISSTHSGIYSSGHTFFSMYSTLKLFNDIFGNARVLYPGQGAIFVLGGEGRGGGEKYAGGETTTRSMLVGRVNSGQPIAFQANVPLVVESRTPPPRFPLIGSRWELRTWSFRS